MMRARTCFLTLLTLAVVSLPASPTTPPPSRSLLLRVHDVVTEGLTGTVTEVTTLVFRDRLVVEEAVTGGRCSHVLRAVASNTALANLNQVLARHRIGAQTGNCRVHNDFPEFVSRDTTITWFGARNRRNTFRVGDEVGTQSCPDEAELIRKAIDDYVQRAGSDDPQAFFAMPCGADGGLE
jgi:hypothetical protein